MKARSLLFFGMSTVIVVIMFVISAWRYHERLRIEQCWRSFMGFVSLDEADNAYEMLSVRYRDDVLYDQFYTELRDNERSGYLWHLEVSGLSQRVYDTRLNIFGTRGRITSAAMKRCYAFQDYHRSGMQVNADFIKENGEWRVRSRPYVIWR